MREIKFRAWDRKHNEWLGADSWFVHSSESVLVVWPQVEKGFEVSVHMETLGVDRIALMQYTGLKDMNGVEIYEGDVVRSFSNINKKSAPHLSAAEPTYRTSSVEFYNGAFRLTCDEFPHGCGILNNYVGAMAEDLEVIGNIYEHGHLLENESKE